MAMDSNSTVKITIDVIDANSGAKVAQVSKNISSLEGSTKSVGNATQRLAASLKEAGAAGAKAGKEIADGMKEAGSHTLTNLDYVRQLRDDLGIRIPRSMEKFISQSQLATTLIGGLGSALIGVGGIEIFARIGAAAVQFWHKLGDINAELRKYAEAAGQAAQVKLFDSSSIETNLGLIGQLTSRLDVLEQKRKTVGVGLDNSGSMLQYLGGAYLKDYHPVTKGDLQQEAGLRANIDAQKERQRLLAQQSQMEQLQADNAVRMVGKVGLAAIAAKAQADEAVAALKKQQTLQNEQAAHDASVAARSLQQQMGIKREEHLTQVYNPDPDAGSAQYGDEVAKARAEAAAQSSAEARKNHQETLHIQAEAHAAELRGEAKFAAELAEAERQLLDQRNETLIGERDYLERKAAMEQKAAAESLQRLATENAETKRLHDEAASAGQGSVARISGGMNAQLDELQRHAPDFSDPETASRREADIRARANAQIEKETDGFNERLTSMEMGRANATMSVNQRIDLDTQRTIREMQKAQKDYADGLAADDARRVTSAQATEAAIQQVQADAMKQKQAARQELLDATRKAEDEGASYGPNKEQEQTRRILDEYTERVDKLKELRDKDLDNADLYNRQILAQEEIKNGKLLDMQRQQSQKLEGLLKGLMGKHPLEALADAGREASAKYASQLLTQSPWGRKAMGSMSKTGDEGIPLPFGWAGKHPHTLDNTAGATPHPGTLSTSSTTQTHPAAQTAATASVSAASTTLTAGSAVIHITGQAVFPGGGAGASLPAGTPGTSATRSSAIAAASPGAPSSGTAGFTSETSSSSASSDAGGFGSSGPLAPGAWTGAEAQGAGPGVAAPPTFAMGESGAQQGLNDVNATMNVASSVQDIGSTIAGGASLGGLGSGGTGSPAPGDSTDGASTASTASSGGKMFGQIGSGTLGMYGAVESDGGLGGALQGAEAGAQLGGVAGALIGAGIGFMGFGGQQKARRYDKTQLRPHIASDLLAFEMGSMPYQSAYDDLNALEHEAQVQTKQWGPGGVREYNDHIKKEFTVAFDKLTREQKAGRSQYGMNASQFDMGGPIRGFGDMATTGTNGWIHAQQGEFVLNQQAALSHYQAATLINGGATHSDMARYYGGSGAGQTMQPVSSGGDTNITIHAIDAKGVHEFLMDNKHAVRGAYNASYAENSGGSDLG